MIYLIRHGESTFDKEMRISCNEHNGNLTNMGQKQARLVGDWLALKGITHIYTSPFPYTQQTADIIGKIIKVEPQINADLAELNCGELQGRDDPFSIGRWEEMFNRWKRAEWDATYPGGESYREAYTRFHRAIQQGEYGENTVLLTHSSISEAVVPYLCVNAAALQRVDPLSNTGIVVLEPYTPGSGRYACNSWNLIEHLTNQSDR